MAILSPPLEVARIVKPRKGVDEQVKIIVCDQNGQCWYEDLPEFRWEIAGLVKYLSEGWPQTEDKRRIKIALVCHNPHKVLESVEQAYSDHPEWNVRLTVSEGESQDDEGCTFYRKERIRVAYFGFRDKHRHTKYFYPISSLDFIKNLEEYGDENDTELIKLYRFGCALRQFCRKNSLRIAASRGGISTQLLRDSSFYPHARRKVPLKTNEAARPALPGNCYQMTERNYDRFFQGIYVIDQQNAHHFAAESVDLPHADDLFAYGWYFNQSDDEWLNYRDPLFQEALNEYGLFRVRASIPRHLSGYLPPWCRAHGENVGGSVLSNIWLYSNELQLALSYGIQIRHISRWYASDVSDSGLAKYAEWSQRTVSENGTQKAWLKPTLLSAYGILGARPRYMESGYKRAEGGEDHTYVLRGQPFQYRQVKTKRKIQSPVANVIQRGMIEAETRKLSIELARQLEDEDHNVIGIHADAVLVENTGQQLPLLAPPWRVKDCLTRFRALDAVSFESDELEILPGRPRQARKRNRSKNKNGNVRQRQGIRA